MATLVLTAVGTAIGGPVGGAIGAGLGSAIDRATILKPGRREGPRLTELALQTSSYGTQIARLFGTMRVAGSVIWASPLIESRGTSRGGKGQPSVTAYSYAASFAVLLSARPILSVGRIWADGTLIRGAAGDWKVKTGFRVHTGGEDQAVDPLIASVEGGVEGVDGTPAYRGCGYVVFEQLALGEWGNRIPQLTFEVTADAGPVGMGAVAAALADEVDADVRGDLGGFAATGGSVRAVLETLGDLSGAWFAARGDRVVMRGPDGAGATRIADAGFANDQSAGGTGMRRIAAADRAPRTVTVAHYDPARDYQTGLQRAGSGGGSSGREMRIDAAAVMTAGAAKQLARAVLKRSEAARYQRIMLPGPAATGIAPGDVVMVEGEGGGEVARQRVTAASVEGLQVRLTLSPVAAAPGSGAIGPGATSGRVMGAADVPVGPTMLAAFETPVLDGTLATMPRLSVAAAGETPGWRGAALLYSLDDGASWIAAGGTAEAAAIGRVTAVEAEAFVIGLREDIDLADADAAALEAGANLALIGDELVGYGRAEPLGAGGWRLSMLRRGLRGTEAAAGTQDAGTRFVLMETAAIRTIDLPLAAIGRTVRVMASGAGDAPDAAEAACVLTGASLRPPAPADLRVSEEEGVRTLRWTRRSRLGWGWTGPGAPPLAEEREAYAVTLTLGGGARRTAETTVPELALDAAGDATAAEVVQHGTFAESLPAAIAFQAGE